MGGVRLFDVRFEQKFKLGGVFRMKKVKLKKWFAVLLALSLTVTLLSGTVYAEETEQQTEQGDSAEKKEDSDLEWGDADVLKTETAPDEEEAPEETEQPQIPEEKQGDSAGENAETKTEKTACQKTEGCTLEDGHEGDCIMQKTDEESQKNEDQKKAPDSKEVPEDSNSDTDGQESGPAEKVTEAASVTVTETKTVALLDASDGSDDETAGPFMVGETGYSDLNTAISAIGESGTITLADNATQPDKVAVPKDTNIVLDLGGRTLTVSELSRESDLESGAACDAALVNQGTLTVRNGSLDAGSGSIVNYGSLTLEDGATILDTGKTSDVSNKYLIVNLGGDVTTSANITSTYNAIVTYGGTVKINGGTVRAEQNEGSALVIFNRGYNNESAGAAVTITGGTLSSKGYAASTNNLYSGGDQGSSLTITGGTLTSHYSTVYWPSSGTLTIGTEDSEEGPDLKSTNGSAVEICSGMLNIYGGTLRGGTDMGEKDSVPTGKELVAAYRSNSGSASMGDAVTVISHRADGYITAPVQVTIKGGTFDSHMNYGVRYMDCNMAEGTEQLDQKVTVEISGGSFSGELAAVDAQYVQEKDKEFITGGTFSSDIGAYTGLVSVKNEDGSYTVEKPSQDNAAASVERSGEIFYYTSLEDALEEAVSGDTVVLLQNQEENISIPEGISLMLDLNGKTLSVTEPVKVYGNGTSLTVKDSSAAADPSVSEDFSTVTYEAGKIVNTRTERSANAVTIEARNGASFVLESGILESVKNYTVAVYGNTSPKGGSISTTASIHGGYQIGQEGGPAVFGNGAVLNIDGGVIVGRDNSAVAGNGTVNGNANYGGTTINISGGTLIGRIETDNYNANAVYQPQSGVLNISGGTIYADNGTAVVVRAGEVNITGGTIISTGNQEGHVGDSSISLPASAVVVDVSAGYLGAEEGTFKLNISGGASVTAEEGVDAVRVILPEGESLASNWIAVSGGSFSSRVNENYCAEGYKPTNKLGNGKYTVQTEKINECAAKVGDVSYTTVKEAIDAVQAGIGNTIVLQKNVTESISVPAGVEAVLDLNGCTLTNTDGSHTIINNGTLTVRDGSNTGKGTVDNITHAKAAVYNTGTFMLESGKLTRSQEAGTSPSNNGGNSYYVVENHGSMTISGGSVTATGKYSSLVVNKTTEGKEVSLAITGGDLKNEFIAVKNEDYCKLEISGGTVTSPEQALQNWGSAQISGGTMDGPVITWSYGDVASETVIYGSAVINGDVKAVNYMDASAVPTVTVTGGTIKGTLSKGTHDGSTGIKMDLEDSSKSVIQVSGGSFSNKVSEEFCAPGFVPTGVRVDGMYTVEKEETVPEEPGTDTPENPGIDTPENPGTDIPENPDTDTPENPKPDTSAKPAPGKGHGSGSSSDSGSDSNSGAASAASDVAAVNSAKTGDETNILLPTAMFVVGVSALAVCIAVMRKKNIMLKKKDI